MPSPLYMLLARIAVSCALAGCLAWIMEYTFRSGWRNSVGRTLMVKTLLLCGLLLISLLFSLLRFSPAWQDFLRWADLVMLALIGPVMAWRLLVFRKMGRSLARCPSGHVVFRAARFCPQCGLPVRLPGAGRGKRECAG